MIALLATIVALAGLYSAWVFWVYFLLDTAKGGTAITPLDLVTDPAGFWDLIMDINEKGVWSMGSSSSSQKHSEPVNGLFLWLIWIGEAAGVVGTAIYFAISMGSHLPYCERCQRWTRERAGILARTGITPIDELRRRLEAKDLGYLLALPPSQGHQWLRVDLYQCEGCSALHAMTVNLIRLEIDKRGNKTEKAKAVINKMLLSADEVAMLTSYRIPSAEEGYFEAGESATTPETPPTGS